MKVEKEVASGLEKSATIQVSIKNLYVHRSLRLTICHFEKDGVLIRLRGDLDSSTGEAFGEYLQLITSIPCCYVVLDLKRVDYIDTSGLGKFIVGLQQARECNGKLHLCQPSRPVQRLLCQTGVGQFFTVFSSLKEVLGHATMGIPLSEEANHH